MNQRQLKYFLEVYKMKSITKAAKNLYISPQGLSKTIAALETELNVALFQHTGNRIIPTKEAARLSSHAKRVLDELNLISEKLFLNDNAVKILTLYCSYDVPQLISAHFFHKFNKNYPEIRINIKEYPDSEIMKALDRNEIELAILPGPFDFNNISCDPLCTEPFCLVVNKENPLADKNLISLQDLKDVPLVIKDASNTTSRTQFLEFIKKGYEPSIILETSDTHLIHQMAECGYAVGMSLLYIAKKIRSEKIKVISFEDKSLSKTLYLTYNKNNPLSFEAEAFKSSLIEYFYNRCPE